MGNISQGARLWTGSNFSPDSVLPHSVDLDYGEWANIAYSGFPNDQMSSIEVAPNTRVILYQNYDFSGRSAQLDGPVKIAKLNDLGNDLNDRVSSIKVIKVGEPPVAPIGWIKANQFIVFIFLILISVFTAMIIYKRKVQAGSIP